MRLFILPSISLMFFFFVGCSAEKVPTKDDCERLEDRISLVRQQLFDENGDKQDALHVYDSVLQLNVVCSEQALFINLRFDLGNYYYLLQNEDSAIFHFKEALILAEQLDDIESISALKTNLGAAYLGKGFTRSAAQYFKEARKAMDAIGNQDENYWITYINQAVAHMEQEDYSHAQDLLRDVDTDFSPGIKFLHALNSAKLYGLLTDKLQYDKYIQTAARVIDSVPYYRDIYNEVRLEFAHELNDINQQNLLLKEFAPTYNTAYPYLQFLLQRLSIERTGKPLNGKMAFDELCQTLVSNEMLNSNLLLVELRLSYSREFNSAEEVVELLEKRDSIENAQRKQNSFNDLRDFYEVSKIDKINQTNRWLNRQKELLELKQSNSNYLVALLFIVLLFSFFTIILILINKKRKSVYEERRNAMIKRKILAANDRARELNTRLSFEKERNAKIMAKVSKFEILRKQLDDFMKLAAVQFKGDKYQQFKEAELNFKAFFTNYTDLAMIGMSRMTAEISNQTVEVVFADKLSSIEIKVIELILSDFTSKEIAALLSKSEKTIEYYRRNIRKKIGLNAETDLKQQLISILELNQ